MNWDLIKWVAGALLTFAGVKFVFVAFRSLFNKDSMENVLEGIGNKVNDVNQAMVEGIKKSAAKRKAAKKKDNPNEVRAFIR